jgi:hypothetical protein
LSIPHAIAIFLQQACLADKPGKSAAKQLIATGAGSAMRIASATTNWRRFRINPSRFLCTFKNGTDQEHIHVIQITLRENREGFLILCPFTRGRDSGGLFDASGAG